MSLSKQSRNTLQQKTKKTTKIKNNRKSLSQIIRQKKLMFKNLPFQQRRERMWADEAKYHLLLPEAKKVMKKTQ